MGIGELDWAVEVANEIEDKSERFTALERIATTMEQVGMVDRARQLLEQADELLEGWEQLWRKVQKEFCDALVAGEI